MANRELHLELLLGSKIFDADGACVGRLEEVIAEKRGDEWVVREYLVGKMAFLHRFSMLHMASVALGILGAKRNSGYKVPWNKLDLSDPAHLRLHCPAHELETLTIERTKRNRQSRPDVYRNKSKSED
jgi:sporulation protein YlmC with PRC-barrel domain